MKSIWEVDALLGIQKLGEFHSGGTVCTGKFDSCPDYGRGILYVSIHANEGLAICPMSISTIDDGVWTVSGTLKKDKFEKFVNDFIETFGQVLPTEEELNLFLRNYGLFGMYTG